ncbi:MATH domain and coiled-coil domain-containing protein At3g58270-like [Bidens hawaiensis]|uniref:MATH domain and coiled-coil domain-containing protein At3g58270-like n=1 Tax=Bidens hawaiensis TaxID=980011 RepID=UPI004049574A
MAIEESCLETLRSTSMAPPAHYILNIQQFSLLTKLNVERYESNEFEATGYKWKLVIHPNGNRSKNVGEFLSAYLAMADSNSLPLDYAADEMSEGGRFQRLRTERGFDKFISLKELGNSNIGYLVGDKCVFGVEVFLSNETSKCKTECLSMAKDAVSYKHMEDRLLKTSM